MPPEATEDNFVTGTKVVTTPPRNARVPSINRNSGSSVIRLPSVTKTMQQRIQKLYSNPDTMSKNAIGKLSEGAKGSLLKTQQLLYQAGYYDSNDNVLFGYRTPSDFTAMSRAMEAANARGQTWQNEANNRIYLMSSGAMASPYSTASTYSGSSGSGSGKQINKSLNITGPKAARSTLKQMYLKYSGKNIDDKLFTSFYDDLVKAQQKAPIVYKKQKVGGSWYNVQVSDGVDAGEFAETWVFNKINFSDDSLAGVARENLTAVNELANMYDVNLSMAEKAKFAKGLTTATSTDNDVRIALANKAKLKYKALAGDITETVTVKDLLSEQLSAFAQTLERDVKSVKVSDIEPYAFKDGNLLNFSETVQSIKNNNLSYRSTSQANQNASSFALGLARSLGYGV